MKKRFFAVILAIMLLVSAAPAAFADTIVNLGSTPAGTYYDHSITDTIPLLTFKLDVDSEEGNKLPDGIELVETIGLSRNFYLRGTPSTIGTFSFKLRATYLDSNYDIIEYSLTVTPPAPVVTPSGSVNCSQGDKATVSVSVSNVGDGSGVSYQWYRSSVNSNVDGTVISGANSASLSVDTSVSGTTYYYCYVSNSGVGISSTPIAVNVAGAAVASISIAKLPSKTEYVVGESLDTTGLAVNVTYTNGKNEIKNDITVPATKFTKAGTENITVTYQDKQATFSVEVKEDDKVTEIGITKMPTKLEYVVGERLDTTGMELKVEKGTGFELITSGFTCNPNSFNFEGTQTITVTYEGQSCTFKVTVKSDNSLSGIAVTKTPDKLEYTVGESLDITGMEVTAKYGDSDKIGKKITNFTCDPMVFETANKRQMVTVKFEGKTCVFMVSVKEAGAEDAASAETEQSPEVSPESTVSPQITPAKKTKNKAPIIIAIIICAILAVSVAGAYVYVTLKNNGKNSVKDKKPAEKRTSAPFEPEAKDFYDPKEFKKK